MTRYPPWSLTDIHVLQQPVNTSFVTLIHTHSLIYYPTVSSHSLAFPTWYSNLTEQSDPALTYSNICQYQVKALLFPWPLADVIWQPYKYRVYIFISHLMQKLLRHNIMPWPLNHVSQHQIPQIRKFTLGNSAYV